MSGTEAPQPVTDWSAFDDPILALEVRPDDPYSVELRGYVVDGKLYLFVNAAIFEKYLEDKDAVIAGAEEKWPGIRATPIEEL